MISPTINSPAPPSTRLFIGSLPYNFTEGELLSLFAPFGRVVFVKIAHNPWGKSRGLGFVEFDNLDSALEAKKTLHRHQIEDRTIIVDYAQPDPFKTPEGQQRHRQAVFAKNIKTNKYSFGRKNQDHQPAASRPAVSPGSPSGSSRQSVYDSRHHHSRVGSKFAKRTRKSK